MTGCVDYDCLFGKVDVIDNDGISSSRALNLNLQQPQPTVQNRLSTMSRDSSRNPLHLHSASHADLLEDFTRTPLLPDEIFLPPAFQPINPEDEDDVVPDQHAAFGIKAAIKKQNEAGGEPRWRDLRLEELVRGIAEGQSNGGAGSGAAGGGAGAGSGNVGVMLRARRAAGGAAGVNGVGVSVGAGLRS